MFQIIKMLAKKKTLKSSEKLSNPESTNVLAQDTVAWLGKVAEDLIHLLN